MLRTILKKPQQHGAAPTLQSMGITKQLIQEIFDWAHTVATGGTLASYIPELTKVDPEKRAISIGDVHGTIISVGNGQDVRLSIQSVVKPFLYVYALEQGILPEDIAGIEATAMAFNEDPVLRSESLKTTASHPLNNAGGLSSAGAIQDFAAFLEFMRDLTGNPKLAVLEDVFASEMETNSNNRALVYRLVATGRFTSQAEGMKALEHYTRACAIGITAEEAVRACLVITNGGMRGGAVLMKADHAVRAINAMNSFGLYEHTGAISLLAAGTRALSCKSGVGGLIVNIDPYRGAFCTYSPLVDEAGNSVFGKYALVPLNIVLGAPDAMRLSGEEIERCMNKPL